VPTIPAKYRSAVYVAAVIAACVLVGLQLAGVADADAVVAQVTRIVGELVVVAGAVLAALNLPTDEA
jgi:hypothetical protein